MSYLAYSKLTCYAEPWQADISPQLGYVTTMTHTHAIVWRYSPVSSPAGKGHVTRVRLLHPTNNPRHPLPLGTLVPSSTEPGLLIVMPISGKITYWENLSAAASIDSNRQRQQSIQAPVPGMMSGEVVEKITEAELRGFVLTFSSGRLAHLNVNDTQGRPSITVSFLRNGSTQSGGILGSLRDVFHGAGWRKSISAVRAGQSVHRGQRYLVAGTTQGSLQVWDLNWNGTQTLAYDIDAKGELLKALAEGGETFYDQDEHTFEVLDFTMLPHGSYSKEITKPSNSGDCHLLALTVLKGPEASRFALVSLSLEKGLVSVDVVHPIICYRTSIPAHSSWRPQVIVPEPAQTAIVVFEQDVILVSLIEVEETPSSQLQIEAHTLPNPFQDVVMFRRNKPYKVVGCAIDSQDRVENHQSCIIAVHGFGMIRIATLATKDSHSAIARAAVTAQTKIEQAVFFGSMQQNLLDFSPRPETAFSRDDVETAALSISHSIASSTSPFLAVLSPSMEQQLARRATALADLNTHLRQYYPLLRPLIRWRLLWNAEKMAAAQALWKWYDQVVSNPGSRSKDVLAEMIEAIPEYHKQENQPDSGESDGIRHWFVNDVWRLEWVIPYSHEIVELLFKESVEDRRELDAVTKARMTSDAVDIQLATLETAFKFRQERAPEYGFAKETFIDGVLQSVNDFEGIPEFWSSSSLDKSPALILARVKEMVEVSRELAKLLAGDLEDYMERQEEGRELEDGQQDIDAEQTHALMTKLAKGSPRQIQICCQVFSERFRWLKSREDPESKAEGDALDQAYSELRRQQFVELTDLDLPEEGIALAEKYEDMEAILDIFERENGDTNKIGPSIPGRIDNYFVKFKTKWADAYFTRNLNEGQKAVDVLNNEPQFRSHLTTFLHSHPEYAAISWINEISAEREYDRAAVYLDKASKHTDELWAQKVMLSLNKLSMMAATSKSQLKPSNTSSAMRRTDHQIALLKIQENLQGFLHPHVQAAIDNDAAVDLIIDHYAAEAVDERPYLNQLLRQHLQRLLGMQTLQPGHLTELLTLIHNDSAEVSVKSFMATRFFLALKVLRHSCIITNLSMSSRTVALAAKLIWRRVLISSDWRFLNRTELKGDARVSQEIAETPLFQTSVEGYRTRIGPEDQNFWDILPPPLPAEILGAGTIIEELRSLPQYSQLPDKQLADLARDLGVEDVILQRCIDDGRLEDWHKGILEAAKTAVREEADRQGEEKARRQEVEKAFNERMEQKEREKLGVKGEAYIDNREFQALSIDTEGDVDMLV